jgi:FkbM family methyltransferase
MISNYIPAGPKRMVADLSPIFSIRPDTSDVKAVEEVWSKNAYRRMKDNFYPKPGEEWFDLGSNIGAFAVMAHLLGASVLPVEADGTNVALVDTNLAQNHCQAKCLHAAVVDDDYTAHSVGLHTNTAPLALRRHSIARARKESSVVDVPAVRFADLLARHPQAVGIKMNIEGAEIPILQSWRKNTTIKYLVAEWSFDVAPELTALKIAVDSLTDSFDRIHLSKRIDWTLPTFPFYPPNLYIFAWNKG